MGIFLEETSFDAQTWTVSELTSYIRELFEIDYRLQDLVISGELSNFTRARSGHLYFTLKDEGAQLKCVMWRSAADRLGFWPEDGDAVYAHGRISVYEAGGVYQLYAEKLEPAGRGDLALAFEKLKDILAAQGLFDASYKKEIPSLPAKIGIVTSADAAALRDIINVLRRRWPLVSVLVAPTLVQGQDAPAQIVRALEWLDGRNDIDTIIVARGGGSMEDLWAFNDESVARAIFDAQHPVIVGVGHETDFTIADFVADLRAPTPSAAAEISVPDQQEYKAYLFGLQENMLAQIATIVREKRNQLEGLGRSLRHLSPKSSLDNSRQQVDWLLRRLDVAIESQIEIRKARLSVAQAALGAVSPMATLARGYAIVRQQDGVIVRSIGDVSAGDKIGVQVADGQFSADVIEE